MTLSNKIKRNDKHKEQCTCGTTVLGGSTTYTNISNYLYMKSYSYRINFGYFEYHYALLPSD
jgi:hypothetical protein